MVNRCVERVSRVADNQLDLVLRSDFEDLTSLVRLTQREKDCCRFFTFTLDIDTNVVTLVVQVPDDAGDVLTAFASSIGAT
jgi:hypothetical protein